MIAVAEVSTHIPSYWSSEHRSGTRYASLNIETYLYDFPDPISAREELEWWFISINVEPVY